MALCDFHWSSKTIGKQVGAYVIVPDAGEPPFATFYLLHGLSDDYTIWLRRTSIERYAQQYPMIIVMPDGYRGFYTNNDAGPAYATYVAEELVAAVERTFPAKRSRASRGVGGLSMGGYGALRLALGYPQVFASATSHSGAVLHGSRDQPRKGGSFTPAEFQRVFGANPTGTEHDVLALAQRCKSHDVLPKIRIDCGTEDELVADNRDLHAKLDTLSVPHEYAEFSGGHNWEYWDVHVQEALAFHHKHLR
ncbi:MAG: putative tributyrin esterase [Phycisphaerales bacterium]|jgi:S-formylglutathione hydrolase FrmB|nr:putative tributyrin esterase [Phycisphaerales bacterium]